MACMLQPMETLILQIKWSDYAWHPAAVNSKKD
jgi:hypothetical protein